MGSRRSARVVYMSTASQVKRRPGVVDAATKKPRLNRGFWFLLGLLDEAMSEGLEDFGLRQGVARK